ncbi:MAG: transglutaminase-like domain-containing protein [Bacteroidales bacterium]|nr:transglutaminase-like domain-containing protein [Bacteroidales bacterium]
MKNNILARLSLLDDDNEEIINNVKNSLIKEGISILPILEKELYNIENKKAIKNLEEVITKIKYNETETRLGKWIKEGQKDLAEGAWIISLLNDFYISWENLNKKLNDIVQKIWLNFSDNNSDIEKIEKLNFILFNQFKFKSNTYADGLTLPYYYFINDTIETKEGNPFSMAILYISIAQRLNLNIFGVILPVFPVACYVDSSIINEKDLSKIHNHVLFYIDINNNGKFFSKNKIKDALKHFKIEDNQMYYMPVSNWVLLRHYTENLINTYKTNNVKEKVIFYSKLLNKFKDY